MVCASRRSGPPFARAILCLSAIGPWLVAAESRPVVGPLLDGLRNGCASGLATVCAKAALQPFDTLKTLQQANTGRLSLSHGMLRTATSLVHERGVGALYRGLGVALLGSVPAMSLYFAIYQSCKRSLHAHPQLLGDAHPMLAVVISAAIANSFAATLRVPCEVVKQRLQALTSTHYVRCTTYYSPLDDLLLTNCRPACTRRFPQRGTRCAPRAHSASTCRARWRRSWRQRARTPSATPVRAASLVSVTIFRYQIF